MSREQVVRNRGKGGKFYCWIIRQVEHAKNRIIELSNNLLIELVVHYGTYAAVIGRLRPRGLELWFWVLHLCGLIYKQLQRDVMET